MKIPRLKRQANLLSVRIIPESRGFKACTHGHRSSLTEKSIPVSVFNPDIEGMKKPGSRDREPGFA
jgi:hypothetical protein